MNKPPRYNAEKRLVLRARAFGVARPISGVATLTEKENKEAKNAKR